MFKITSSIPAPVRNAKGGAPVKYPFHLLEVGESFFVPGMKARALSNAAQWQAKKLGRTFTCRTEGDGARCWRTA